MLDESLLAVPVSLALQFAVRIPRARVAIIDECDVVPNKNAFLNRDAFTNKCVTGDFAAGPDASVFLDFNKRTDLRFVTNLAPVKVDESADLNIASELNVGRYSLMRGSILIHAKTISPVASPTAGVIW